MQAHPSVKEVLIQSAWQEFERLRRRQDKASAAKQEVIKGLEVQRSNLVKAIAMGGNLESLVTELTAVEKTLAEARREEEERQSQGRAAGGFLSQEDVAKRLDEALRRMVEESFDFADFLRKLIPEFVIFPVQALNCHQIRPRARLTLSLAPWTTNGQGVFTKSVVLDLFESPVHIQHLRACVATKVANPRLSLKRIAVAVGTSYMTVKRAMDYSRRMEREGLTDPYRELSERPEQASRWRRLPQPNSGETQTESPSD